VVGRYEVSEHGWQLIPDLLSSQQVTGRPRRDDRQMLNGILWILCSGAEWRDLSERYGPWKTVYHLVAGDRNFQQALSRLR